MHAHAQISLKSQKYSTFIKKKKKSVYAANSERATAVSDASSCNVYPYPNCKVVLSTHMHTHTEKGGSFFLQ